MPKGGSLTIKTEAMPMDFSPALHSSRSDQGFCVRLSVQDTANVTDCIPPPAVSEPEHSANLKEPSLGLAAVYKVVAQLHGWIDVKTESGRGRTFSLFFPACPELKTSEGGGVRGGSEKILLVEEDRALRRFMLLLLTRLGYSVREASTAAEATEVWNAAKGQFDLLLGDQIVTGNAPNQDLVRQFQANSPGVRAILFIGNNRTEDAPSSRRVRRLAKPFTPETLAQAVRDCLDAP
jgi:CheY-like chemotaxis protein